MFRGVRNQLPSLGEQGFQEDVFFHFKIIGLAEQEGENHLVTLKALVMDLDFTIGNLAIDLMFCGKFKVELNRIKC